MGSRKSAILPTVESSTRRYHNRPSADQQDERLVYILLRAGRVLRGIGLLVAEHKGESSISQLRNPTIKNLVTLSLAKSGIFGDLKSKCLGKFAAGDEKLEFENLMRLTL
jgi:hypothetical protein